MKNSISLERLRIKKGVFLPPAVVLLFVLGAAIVNNDAFSKAVHAVLNFSLKYFGWLYLLGVFFFFVFTVVLLLSPFAKTRLGGPDAKPTLSYFNWFAIALCTGIAIGILFWGVAEPLMHYASPPSLFGVEGKSPESTVVAMQISFLHWTFTPYAIYVIFGLSIAIAVYNLNQPLRMSSALYPMFGEKIHGWPSNVIDSLVIFALVAGEITTLGLGSMQLTQGLNFIFGIPVTNVLYVVTIIGIAAIFTTSSYTGVNKGIRILSDINTKIFFFLIAFVLVTGPTLYIINLGVDSLGAYLHNFIPMHLWADANGTGSGWNGWWTIFYWAWWIIVAPTTGAFLARISYGRTVREFILVNLVAPAIFGMTWFTVMGGAALNMEHVRGIALLEQINQTGVQIAFFAMLDQLPLSSIVVPLAWVAIVISFCTAVDSGVNVVSTMSTDTCATEEAPGAVKIFWGTMIAVLALVFLFVTSSSGISSLQTASIAGALPIYFIGIAAAVSLLLVSLNKGHRPENVKYTYTVDNETSISK